MKEYECGVIEIGEAASGDQNDERDELVNEEVPRWWTLEPGMAVSGTEMWRGVTG